MKTVHRRHAARGFTLIELMVAISLLGVLLILLFSAMRTGIRSWQAAETRIEATEGVVQTERFLARLIRQIHPGGGSGGETTWADLEPRRRGASASFSGTGDRFSLVAPGVSALPRSGLYRYEVFSAPRGDGSDLVDLWIHIDPHRPGEEVVGEPRLLQENVAMFAVRYFGAMEDDRSPAWVDEWSADIGRLPQLVEIRVQPAGAREERPPIIAGPMAAGGA